MHRCCSYCVDSFENIAAANAVILVFRTVLILYECLVSRNTAIGAFYTDVLS